MNILKKIINVVGGKSAIARQHYNDGMEFEMIKYDHQKATRAKFLEKSMALREKQNKGLIFVEHSPYTERYMWSKV